MSWEEIVYGGLGDDPRPAVAGETRREARRRELRARRLRRWSAFGQVLIAVSVVVIVIAGAAAAWIVLYAVAAFQAVMVLLAFVADVLAQAGAAG